MDHQLVYVSDLQPNHQGTNCGYCVLRNVKVETPATTNDCLGGVRAGDIEGLLDKCRFCKMLINVTSIRSY